MGSLSDDSSSFDETERFKQTIVKSHTKAARVNRPFNLLISEAPVPIEEEDEVPLRVKDVIHEEQEEEGDQSSKLFDKDVFVVTNTTFRDGSFVEVSATETAEPLR